MGKKYQTYLQCIWKEKMYITCTIKILYKAVVIYFVIPVSTTVLGIFLLFVETKSLIMSSTVMGQFLLTLFPLVVPPLLQHSGFDTVLELQIVLPHLSLFYGSLYPLPINECC
jgi:hypothetical protein